MDRSTFTLHTISKPACTSAPRERRRILHPQADRQGRGALRQEARRGGGRGRARRGRRGSRAPDRRGRRPALPSARRAGGARRQARRGRGGARRRAPRSPASTRRRRARAADARARTSHGTAHRRRSFALPHAVARRVGGAARRHADDADGGRGDARALAARPPRHEGDRGDLSADLAPALALRGGDAAAVHRAAALPRHRRGEGALHHRRRRLGGGRQVDHRARAAGAAGALAEHAEGRSRHHRRLPAAERRAASAKA